MESFSKENQLGEGAQGVVAKYKVLSPFGVFLQHPDTCPNFVAIKRIRGQDNLHGLPREALREIKILTEMSHDNVMQIFDTFAHRGSIHVVLPLMKTDLFAVIQTKSVVLQAQHIKNFMQQMLRGLQYLHASFVLHRDMKPSNCLIGYDHILRISDFGLAREFGGDDKYLSPQACTLWYRAPELLFGSQHYASGMDMWSLGCVFAEMMLRKPLFQGNDELQTLFKICAVLGTPDKSSWPNVHLLPKFKKMSTVPSMNLQTLFPPATAPTLDLLEKLLRFDPHGRISAEDALKHEYFTEEPAPCEPTELPLVNHLSSI